MIFVYNLFRNVELITEDESIIETEAQDVDEVVMEQQFNDSNIEHFEIIEAEEEVELEDEFEEKHDIRYKLLDKNYSNNK